MGALGDFHARPDEAGKRAEYGQNADKTELFRNQDRLNPVDLSNGVITRLEDARVGQWAAQLVFSPEAWMKVGPVEDLRVELAVIYDDFEPTDLGKCGEATTLALICLKGFGA